MSDDDDLDVAISKRRRREHRRQWAAMGVGFTVVGVILAALILTKVNPQGDQVDKNATGVQKAIKNGATTDKVARAAAGKATHLARKVSHQQARTDDLIDGLRELGFRGLTGSPGQPGIKGDLGATGPQGPKGLPGTDGAPGVNGSPGSSGASVQGPQGSKGDTGPAGPAGPQGERGPEPSAFTFSFVANDTTYQCTVEQDTGTCTAVGAPAASPTP